MNDQDIATLLWYLQYGGLAFIVVLVVTAVLEHFWPEDWPK